MSNIVINVRADEKQVKFSTLPDRSFFAVRNKGEIELCFKVDDGNYFGINKDWESNYAPDLREWVVVPVDVILDVIPHVAISTDITNSEK